MSKPPPPLPVGVKDPSQLEGWLREHPKKETGREPAGPRKIADTECGRPVMGKMIPDPDGPCHDLVDVDDKTRRETFKGTCVFCEAPMIMMSDILKKVPTTRAAKGDIVQCDHCMTGMRVDAINPDTINPGYVLQLSFFAGPRLMALYGYS